MSETHISEEDFLNASQDSHWKNLFTEEGRAMRVPAEVIKDLATNGVPIRLAEDRAIADFDTKFRDELEKIPLWKQNCRNRRSSAVAELSNCKSVLDALRRDKKHEEKTGRREEIPERENKKRITFEVLTWLLLAVDLTSTALFLHNIGGREWLESIIMPLGGVFALVFVGKVIFKSLLDNSSKYLTVVKYGVAAVTLTCAVGWVVCFAEYANSLQSGLSFGDLDGKPVNTADGPLTMIILGSLAEAFLAALLYLSALEICAKFTFHDRVVDTQEYVKARAEHETAEEKVSFIDSRTAHADALVAILEAVRNRMTQDAREIYQLEASKLRNQG